jgi:outer membrane protein OmpA-like peptidoglycan-associated protein
MKKIVLGILFAAFITGNAFSQTNTSKKSQPERVPLSQINGKDYSKWSIAIGGGYDYYRVNPFTQNAGDGFWKYYVRGEGNLFQTYFNPQISVEYDFNPLFGFGFHFGRFGIDRVSGGSPNTNRGGRHTNFGTLYDFSFYESTDLTDLLVPYRKGWWKKWSVYGDLGAGITYYEGDLADAYVASINNNVDLWTKSVWSDGRYNGLTPMFTSFLNAEYSFGRRISMGLGFGYRWYIRDGLGGYSEKSPTVNDEGHDQYKGSTEAQNEDGWNLTLSLRFKFGSSKKTHMRDVRLTDGYDELSKKINKINAQGVTPELLQRIKDLEDAIKPINDRLNDLEGKVANVVVNPKPDDWREGKGTAANPWTIQGVNFMFDKTTIIDKSNPILQSVLVKLIAHYNEWNTLKIDGHTDWFGTEKYNEGLALRRANAIKQFFIDHGLAEKEFIVEGFGERKPIAPNATPDGKDDPEGRQENRRVELYIVK